MNIEIKTDEVDKKIKFKIDNEEFREFGYSSLDILISKSMTNDNPISFKTEEKLEDYETLITKIIEEARSEDFKNAVSAVMEAKEEYENSLKTDEN